jgi:four helix bundle protein
MQNDKSKFKSEFKKRLYSFPLTLIEFIDKLPSKNVSRRLGDQLLRSGTSIIANYVERPSASSKKDYINYFTIALKSSNESKLWLCLLKDSHRAKEEQVDSLLKEFIEIFSLQYNDIEREVNFIFLI